MIKKVVMYVDVDDKLLEDDSMMIQEIAEAVGYDSAYSFSRLFKKKVGMSPNDYRLSVHKI